LTRLPFLSRNIPNDVYRSINVAWELLCWELIGITAHCEQKKQKPDGNPSGF
jgi:hypothetical protein